MGQRCSDWPTTEMSGFDKRALMKRYAAAARLRVESEELLSFRMRSAFRRLVKFRRRRKGGLRMAFSIQQAPKEVVTRNQSPVASQCPAWTIFSGVKNVLSTAPILMYQPSSWLSVPGE